MTNRDVFELLLKKNGKTSILFLCDKRAVSLKECRSCASLRTGKNALVFRKLKKFHPFSHFQNYCK